MGKGKKNANGNTRRFWNKREEEFLLNVMKDLVNDVNYRRLDCGQFKGGFYKECEKKIILAFPGTDLRAYPHIESKIKIWRKTFNLVQDMRQASGFGWDDTEKMILVDSDDVWDNYVRVYILTLLRLELKIIRFAYLSFGLSKTIFLSLFCRGFRMQGT